MQTNRGAQSFVGIAIVTVLTIVGFALITGSKAVLLGLLGLIVVLVLANMLDRKR